MKHRYSCGLFILLIGGWLLSSCENDLSEVQALDQQVEFIDRYKNIEFTFSDSALIRVRIEAPLMEIHNPTKADHEDHFPEGVFVEFYDEWGHINSRLRAKKAIRYVKKNIIEVRDSVALVSADSSRLRTEQLFWNSKTGELYTDSYFKIVNKGDITTGRKLRTDQEFKNYSFEGFSGQVMQMNMTKKE